MTDTFFDLQRFAVTKAVLVGGESSFSWKDGTTFGAGASTAVGTESNPAYLDAKGGYSTAGTSTAVYLSGEKSYSFSLDGKTNWDLKLGSGGVAQVTNNDGTLALSELNDTVAVLNVNGTFEETINDSNVYIKTAGDTKATINSVFSLLDETFGKDASNIDIVVGGGVAADFSKGASDINVGFTKDNLVKGFSFEKAAGVYAASTGEIAVSSNKNNTVTLPGGDVWTVKKGSNESISPTIYFDIANNAADSVLGIKGATLESANGVNSPVIVGSSLADATAWNTISGSMSSIAFDSVGSALIDNTGAVTVDGADGATATIKNLTEATVNDIKVTSAEKGTVGFELETVEGGGISAVVLKKQLGAITVNEDTDFDVVVGKASYGVTTDASSVTFDASPGGIDVNVAKEKSYSVTGNAEYIFADDAKNATINGANISLGSAEGVVAGSDDDHAGITSLTGLAIGKAVSVANDSDGFTATFNAVDGNDPVTFEVNGASITAAGIYGQTVSVAVDGTGKDVTVTGMGSTDSVTVAGGDGVVYHFKDATAENRVAPSAGDSLFVTLSSDAVVDSMDAESYKKLKENDAGKWNNAASIGNQDSDADPEDTVPANLSDVFKQFYNLGTSEAGGVSRAGFTNEDSTTFETSSVAGGVNFSGRNGGALSSEAHVTLSAGANVNRAPVNIQRNESDAAVDVVVDLSAETVPATVAIGTLADNLETDVTASHKIYLSNAGGFAYLGERATGQNQVFAGTIGAQIRHDGSNRATINGGAGADTIWAGRNDLVAGSTGADQFYDSANYTITDYNFSQGDALIATRLNTVNFARGDVNSSVNTVSFGSSRNAFTIGNDQNAPLFLNVAIMDTEANLVGNRTVVLAGANGGSVNASAITSGALIIADEVRNGKSGDAITGTAGNDQIYVSANDIVDGGAGNDYITISGVSAAENDGGAKVVLGVGKDTVSGWTFGFDTNAGATELLVDGDYRGLFENDRLMVSTASGSVLFDDTAATSNHGQADVLINGKKYMAIRTTDSNNTNPAASYGSVNSNDELADAYIAEREGMLIIDSGVTKDLGIVQMGGVSYQNITSLVLANNNKALVLGSDARETVILGGDASVGASKEVFLGDGNDVIIATSDDSVRAGNELFFGADDGRDSVFGFNHYLGAEFDPDRKYADTLHIEKYGGIYTGTDESGRSRIEFVTEGDNRVFLYENNGINVNNIYQIQVGNFATKAAKIGNSNTSNVFALDANVDYYVGHSAENAQDTLTVSDIYDNVNVWLDGSNGTDHTSADEHYFRGITVIDATAETNTNVSLAGAGGNDTLYAGGEGTYNYLWGGSGDNVLYGSENSKQDYFFYVRNAGAYLQTVDDTVTGGHDEIYNYDFENNDVIWLGDTTLDDIKSTEIGDTSVTIEFNNGGSLTVNSLDNVRVRINEGAECYIADRDSKTWSHE